MLDKTLDEQNISTGLGYCRSLHDSDSFRMHHSDDKSPVTETICEKFSNYPVGCRSQQLI